jgi:hypothetical protein
VVKFPYEKKSNPFSKTFLKFKNSPILKIGLSSGPGQLCKIEAYIDTGAQCCMFDNQYAKHLGIDDYKRVKSSEDVLELCGIGGIKTENVAYFHNLRLFVFKDQKHLELKNAFSPIDTKIGFLEKPLQVAGILGVYGFLDQFLFKANIPEGYFELEPLYDIASLSSQSASIKNQPQRFS